MNTNLIPQQIYDLTLKMKTLATHHATPQNEARVALSKMRQLMFKYGITEHELKANTKKTVIVSHDIIEKRNLYAWEKMLAVILCDFCGCVSLYRRRGLSHESTLMEFYGTEKDVKFAKHLFITLRREFMQAGGRNYKEYFDPPAAGYFPSRQKWIRSYCVGCVHGLHKLIILIDSENAPKNNCNTLAITKVSQVHNFIEEKLGVIPIKKIRGQDIYSTAFTVGIKKGQQANLNRPIEDHPENAHKQLTNLL